MRSIVPVVFVVGLLVSPVVAVGQSSPAETQEVAVERSAESASAEELANAQGSPFWWLYVSGLGLAVLLPVGFFFYRRFGGEEEYEFDREDFPAEAPPAEQPALVDGNPSDSGLSAPEKAFFSVEESSPSQTTARMAISQSGGAERMCPECGEQFPASVVLCPYDSTPLQNIDDDRPVSSSEQTVLERQRCPGCGRRYEPAPDFCYHDGMRLRQDTVEEAEKAPTYKVCETCGWEGETGERICPSDGTELTSVNPSEDGRVSPPVPVLICPECESFAEPGRGRCPEDGAVLTPLHNAHVTQLPERGFGPRRKICQECGETFSQGARYCSYDGSELVPMN